MAYQNMTSEFGKVFEITELLGSDFMGVSLSAPLTKYKVKFGEKISMK